MKKYNEILKNSPLFYKIDMDSFEQILSCISPKVMSYKKDEVILLTGNRVDFVGLILRGRVKIVKEDVDGNSSILANLTKSELFAEVFACAEIDCSPVTVVATEDCEVLFMDYRKIIHTCSSSCQFHRELVENMLKVVARKNLLLNEKIEILSKRSTREKLRAFLNMQKGAANKFTIPFNREELADYLCVDRSAMSKELCKMRDEGLLQFNRNRFEVLW